MCNITSQYTAELYVPSSGVLCSLPQLPDKRWIHTMESSGLLCGGLYTKDSCVQWSPANGTWNKLLTMDDERYSHVSWTPSTGNGTYLIGGIYSRTRKTTTLIRPDGTQDPGFPLKYVTEEACAIPSEDTVIITGGVRYGDRLNTVSVYTVEGWQEDLPPLNTNRSAHACSIYWSVDRRILIVTGGEVRLLTYTDTTEIFDHNLGRWTTSGAKLPRPMGELKAVNIDGRVLIFGGRPYAKPYAKPDDILEYDQEQDSIVPVGQKLKARAYHAVSVVKVQDYAKWCLHPQQPSSSARISPVVLTLTFCFFKH